jgi:catechol 2,3-dioxygenase-like lactoylglutathione lyase family enzyme
VSVPGIVVAVFDHVTIRVSDRAASERVYTTVLGTLGVEPTYAGDDFVEWENDFSIGAADAEHPVTRAAYHPGYYGAYVLDPDGHNVEAVSHNR